MNIFSSLVLRCICPDKLDAHKDWMLRCRTLCADCMRICATCYASEYYTGGTFIYSKRTKRDYCPTCWAERKRDIAAILHTAMKIKLKEKPLT